MFDCSHKLHCQSICERCFHGLIQKIILINIFSNGIILTMQITFNDCCYKRRKFVVISNIYVGFIVNQNVDHLIVACAKIEHHLALLDRWKKIEITSDNRPGKCRLSEFISAIQCSSFVSQHLNDACFVWINIKI